MAARIVYTMQSEEAVVMYRLVIAEASRMPWLAAAFYEHGPARSIALLRSRLSLEERSPVPDMAESLYIVLLGERHRRRLLGLVPAPTPQESRTQARQSIAALGFSQSSPLAGINDPVA
ncbi:TetR/AcrR family transcriptional regulator C-terminal domain-containing protein [Arthrobacter sp. RHLT1-20]